MLQRAIKTFEIAAQTAGFKHLIAEKDEALNERMYGDLQGLNKDECRENSARNRFISGEEVLMFLLRAAKA